MKKISYEVDGREHSFQDPELVEFNFGLSEVLSQKDTDITFDQPWYNLGYSAISVFNDDEFNFLKKGVSLCIQKIIEKQLGIEIEGFDLEKYHHLVKTNEDHFKIVSQTRDLFPEDFNFSLTDVVQRFGKILGFELTDINPKNNERLHIIIRVNRPGSSDYNPPHKDIYETVDSAEAYIPQFLNLWIPICGVTDKTSLPLAKSSHLIEESKILRTFEGGELSGNKYRVRMIKEWDGSNTLQRADVKNGEALFFSSHLIHGLAINEEEDTTRVSLEFRLFKKEK